MDERIKKIEELLKQKMVLTKKYKWQLNDNQEMLELAIKLVDLIDEMNQEYYTLSNLAYGFVDLMPSHKLYHSCRDDLKECLKKIKGY